MKKMGSGIKNKIKGIRELKNYTQEYMAGKLNITQAAYSKIEKGATGLSYSNLEKIAMIFEVHVENIIQFDFSASFTDHRMHKADISDGQYQKKETNMIDLYADKIFLLEKLLSATDLELQRYKDRFGQF